MEEGEVVIPIRDGSRRNGTTAPSSLMPARRMPAAIIGILLMAALGMTVTHGWTALMGQAASEEQVQVLITEEGVNPASVTVTAGQNVLFKNDSSIPQLLRFETLMDDTGNPVETSPIFPLSEARIVIPAGIPPGEYPYFSSTSKLVSGSIVVVAPGSSVPSFETVASASAASSMQPVVSSWETASSVASSIQPSMSSVDIVQPIVPPVAIPTNPYVIGSDSNQITVVPPVADVTADITEHTPLANTESGIAAWTTVLIFAASMMFVLRKART